MLEPNEPWVGQDSWHTLEIGFGAGPHFLAQWHAWRQTPDRPTHLHYTAIEPQPVSAEALLRNAQAFPVLVPLANELARHWFGWVTGTHRIELDQGRVHLTLHVGAAETVLPTLDAAVDRVMLSEPTAAKPSNAWSIHLLKAVGKLCRRGARLTAQTQVGALREDLVTAGFVINETPEPEGVCATYAPRWTPVSHVRLPGSFSERSAVVIGGGLAGSAAAYSLAQRGWTVTVLDAGGEPAAGASALPAGLVAPHVSPDDASLSRLSRVGVRLTLQRAAALLQTGSDWALTGVLEHRVEARRGLPDTASWREWGSDWSRPANAEQQARCGLTGRDTLWHPHAGWIRPAQLVKAQLRHPNIRWQGNADVHRLQRTEAGWNVLDADDHLLASAPLVVLATAWHTKALLASTGFESLPLNPLRGQVTWGSMASVASPRTALPPFPVNGHGALVHGIPGPDGRPAWVIGSTFERAMPEPVIRAEDRSANFLKLQGLLPDAAALLAPQFDTAHDWAGVRCTLPDRVPAVGLVASQALPGLAVCTGLGARGLTLSVLCGEWLAASLHGEPWPMERKLAESLNAARFRR